MNFDFENLTSIFDKVVLENISDDKYKEILVAYSGGIDSTALLYLANKFSKKYNKNIKAIHVNHNINIKSKKTSDFISFMKNIDIFNKKTLILVDSFQEDLILSSRNIRNVFIDNVKCVSVYDLLDAEIVIIDKIGIGTFSEVLA